MARWDIHPAGVRGVLTKVETHAESLGTSVKAFATSLESAGSACGQSIVTAALGDFAKHRTGDLTAAGTRIKTAMTGTVNAVGDYLKGDLAMAANAQHAAGQKAGK